MAIRIILDGKNISEIPQGADDLRASVKTDKDLKIRYISEDATLTFTRDGYQYIRSLDNEGFCGEIKIQIEEDEETGEWEILYDGIIHLPACEFGIAPYYVKCQVDDNSFFARINKNKSLKALFTSDRSKNDVSITPAQHQLITYFRPSTGAYSYPNRWIYSLYESLRFLIDWMSDGEVGFASDTFGIGGAYSESGIIIGAELRAGPTNGHDKQPEIEFAKIFEEFNKKYNIMIGVESDQSGKPVIRIEAEQNFFNSGQVSATLNYCKEIKRKVDSSRLYASINAGSDKTDNSSGAVQYPETTRWITFQAEQYPSLGQCNIETAYDLVSGFIISSNVIEQIVVNNIEDYDEDIIFTEYDPALLQAKQSNWLGAGPPYFYNEGLKNDSVVARHLSGIPSSIANFLGTSNDARFHAKPSIDRFGNIPIHAGGSQGIPFVCDDDFTAPAFDPNNNYGNGVAQGTLIALNSNRRYTASQGGLYKFSALNHSIIHNHSFGSSANFFATASRFNSFGTLISQLNFFLSIPPGITADLPMSHSINFQFLLNTTDFVRVQWFVANQNINNPSLQLQLSVKQDSFFRCEVTSFGSGVWATVDDADFNAYLYQIRHKFSKREWNLIKNNLSSAIYFNEDGQANYKAWINQATFYRGRGYIDLTLISNHRLKP